MRVVVIYNPSAGKGKGSALAAATRSALLERGFDAELHATRGPKHATAIAHSLSPSADIVVAVGGDGTVNEIVNGMAQSVVPREIPADRENRPATSGGTSPPDERRRARLGIVPAGTVNVLARELKLPFQVDQACATIAAGNTKALDLGDINGRSFVLMAGAGVDALTVQHVDLEAKRRFRELAFIGSGLRRGFAARHPEFLVRAAGQEYRATFLVTANSRYYANRLSVARSADPTDGLLDLVLFTGTGRLSLAVFWLGIPSGLHLYNRHVKYVRTPEADLLPLNDRDVIWLQTDGELAGRLPAKVKVHPHILDVLVP